MQKNILIRKKVNFNIDDDVTTLETNNYNKHIT